MTLEPFGLVQVGYRRTVRFVVLIALVVARVAHADVPLAEGQVEADVTIEANMHPSHFAQPLSLAPDLWFGATDRLTLGIVHSGPAIDRLQPGASFCLVEELPGCDRLWQRGGIDALWIARTGELAVAPRLRFLIRDIDPVKPAVTLGALVTWTHGRFAVTGDPFLQFGLANQARGNRAAIFLPITLTVVPTCRWAIDLRTGWNSEFAVIDDGGWHIPMWLGARAQATAHVEVGAAIGFYSALGPQNDGNERALFATVGYRS
jgi:hypothetical protein